MLAKQTYDGMSYAPRIQFNVPLFRSTSWEWAADPVFVVGTGRSGTTVMARCLGRHPDLLLIDEPRFISQILLPVLHGQMDPQRARAALRIWSDGSGKEPMKFLRRMREHYGAELHEDGLECIHQTVERACFDFVSSVLDLEMQARYVALRFTVSQIVTATLQLLGGSNWLIKEPASTLVMEDLVLAFPKSRFVHIMRHPADVLCSRLDHGFQSSFDQALEVWFKRSIAAAHFARQQRTHVHNVVFENLAADPERTLCRVLDFLALSECAGCGQEFIAGKANIGRSRGLLNRAQVRRLSAACAEIDAVGGGGWLPRVYSVI